MPTPYAILARHDDATPAPDQWTDRQLPGRLWELLCACATRRCFFQSTDHLSDRDFYTWLWELWLNELTADIPPEAETNTHTIISECNVNCLTSGEVWLRY